jgi:four helix bundle protein
VPDPLSSPSNPMNAFDHENLDVYKAAIDFVAVADQVIEQLPRGRGYLVDQLQRAATSVALSIAEGAGEFSGSEKARFYRIARRSATECAAILHVLRRLRLIESERYEVGRGLLLRIVAMLVQMVRRVGESGTGTGSGSGSGSGRR